MFRSQAAPEVRAGASSREAQTDSSPAQSGILHTGYGG